MKVDEAKQVIRKLLPEKRFLHSVGVSETAGQLAERYGADRQKAELAGMLHDSVKYFSDDDLKTIIRRSSDVSHDFLEYSDKLWHAPAGAVYAKETLGVTDSDVLNAMIYHTTGRPGMTLLEKIVFVADYIEPGRDFPGVENVRKAAKEQLDDAVFLELQQTIIHLLKKRQRVYPGTIAAYNDLVSKVH